MRLTGTAQRLTIIVGDSRHWHHKPLYSEIVRRAHDAGLAGATVLHGVEVIRYVGTNPEGTGGGHAPVDTGGHER